MAYNDIKVDGIDDIYAADYNTIVSLLDGFIASKAQNNGLASLGADGKVPSTQLPSSILGTVKYQGTWAASSGTYPTNPSLGYYYVCSDAGTVGAISYAPTDIIIYNGSTWDKIDNTEIITSVDGRTGIVTLSDLYLGISAKASDSNLLDGQDSTYFATALHDHNSTYLGINAKATDSNLLDGMDSTSFATTGHIHAQSNITNLVSDMATKAPLASPSLTGIPTAPTAAIDTNTTQLATTAYVLGQASATTPMKPTMVGSVGTSNRYARADHVHPSVTPFNSLTCSQDIERRFFKDDFSNNTIGQYTATGAPSIASGVLTLATTEKAIKALNVGDTYGKWESTIQFTTTYSVDQSCKLYFGATSYLDIQRKTGNAIYLQLTVNGSSLIAATDTTATLADSTDGRGHVTYDGTNYQMCWNGVAVGSATVGSSPTTPSIGVLATASTVIINEITYSPSVAFTDPFTSDTEARYMQLSSADITLPSPTGTWAAAIAGDVVVSGGKMTLASTASTYQEALCSVLRSYNFGSGEYEFAFDNNNDGGGGIDSCGIVFGYQDILNHYKLVLNDDAAGAETLKLYKVVAGTATQLGSTADVSSAYTRGNKTWLKLHWDAIKGQFWVYLRDDSGTYPTTPNIADAFSAQFTYGKCGFWAAVTTVGESNLNVDFYPITIRALSLIGETNVPATESNFYFRDEFSVDDSARWARNTGTTDGTWSVTDEKLQMQGDGKFGYYRLLPFYFKSGTISVDMQEASGLDTASFMSLIIYGKNILTGYASVYEGLQLILCNINLYLVERYGNGAIKTTIIKSDCVIGTNYNVSITVDLDAKTVSMSVDGAAPVSTTFTSAYIPCRIVLGAKASSGATRTFYFDNLTISGTRYYNQPMLRGAQQGAYWDGSAAVPCTRFTDDFNWDTIGEYDQKYRTWTVDTLNGSIGSTDTGGIIKANSLKYGSGEYRLSFIYKSVSSTYYPRLLFGWGGEINASNLPINCYFVQIRANTSATIIYYFDSGGGATLIASSTMSPSLIVGAHYTHRVLWDSTTGSIVFNILDVNNTIIHTISGTNTTLKSGYAGFTGYNLSSSHLIFTKIQINAIESTSGNNPVCIGGVPHGARYDTQEYAVRSFTNAVRYGEYRLAAAIKTTNSSAEDIELYLKNATDSSNITDDASDTVAVALSDTNWANVTKNAFLNADDVSDTITIQARRKTAATDNTPACLVDFVELLPIVEVG